MHANSARTAVLKEKAVQTRAQLCWAVKEHHSMSNLKQTTKQNPKQTKNIPRRKQISNENSTGYWIPCLRFKPRALTITWPTSPTLCVGWMPQSSRNRKNHLLFWPQFSTYQHKQWQMNNHHPTALVIYRTRCWLFPNFQWQHQKNILICSCLKGWRQNRSIYPSLYPFSNQIKEFLLIYKVGQHNTTIPEHLH